MAILDLKEKIEPFRKNATGYVKQLLSADHVVMSDGTTLQTKMDSLNSALTWSNWISLGQNALGIFLIYRYNAFEVEVNYRGNLKAGVSIGGGSAGYQWSGFPENLKPQYNFEAPMYAVAGNNSQLSFRCFPSDGALSITSHYNVKTTEEYISGYYRWTRKL